MTIHIDGFNTYMRDLQRLEKKNVEAFERGMLKAGEHLKTESQKLVPVDTGALKKSAYVRINRHRARKRTLLTSTKVFFRKASDGVATMNDSPEMTVKVGYKINYSVYVHEDLTMNHPNGGQAKYLEQPAREHRRVMFNIVRDEVMDSLG